MTERDPRVKPDNDTRLGNSRIAYYVIPQLELGISIWNSRIFVIASEAKQSLEILDLVLEILEFLKIRHYEALKKEGAIPFIKPCLLSLERDCFGRFAPSQ